MQAHLFFELGGDPVAMEKDLEMPCDLSERLHRMIIRV